MAQTLSKSERLSGKTAVNDLLKKGRWGVTASLKYCWLTSEETERAPRILVSVPKRNFKRAVKRNLLKRRLRESYRVQKDILKGASAMDVMFFYNSKEVLDSSVIKEEVGDILRTLATKTLEK